ncbi:MAG: M56 family metallopeptidase [Planctomycetaceae bacterium]|nr:M56 family metallopeptidase [Planctomycetaceae bacterium]
MSDMLIFPGPALLRTTLLLTVAGLILWFALRHHGHSIFARFAWCGILLLGWFWLQVPCQIPWRSELAATQPQVQYFAQSREEGRVHHAVIEVMQPPGDFGVSESLREIPMQKLSTPASLSETQTSNIRQLVTKYLLAVWGLGMLVTVLRWFASYCQVLWQLRQTVPADDETMALWAAIQGGQPISERLRRRKPTGIPVQSTARDRSEIGHPPDPACDPGPDSIPVLFTERLGPSLVWTPWGYRLVIPREVWDDLPPHACAGILRHELAHYLRRDAWKSFAVRILALPHWFNPVAHLAVWKFDEAAECLCDEAAWSGNTESRRAFAEALLALHELMERYVAYRPALWGNGLQHRISRLMNHEKRKELSPMRKLVLLTIVLAMFAAGLFRVELVARTVVRENETVAETVRDTHPELTEPATVKVVHEDGSPFANATIAQFSVLDPNGLDEAGEPISGKRSIYITWFDADENGVVTLNLSPQGNIVQYSPGNADEGGFVVVSDDKPTGKNYTLTVKPLVIGRIQLVDKTSGTPLANVPLKYSFRAVVRNVPIRRVDDQMKTMTDENGFALLPRMIQGLSYRLTLPGNKHLNDRLLTIEQPAENGEPVDLGTVAVDPPEVTTTAEIASPETAAGNVSDRFDLSALEATKDDPHKLGLFITDEKEEEGRWPNETLY